MTMGIIPEVAPQGGAYQDACAEPVGEKELPRYRVPQGSSDPREVRNLVRDELLLDGNAGQNLVTFCTTYDDEPCSLPASA
jgi:glutamate decarboxylase